jgi:septal ring factor EnvC (AmiA/AmiB activator)
MSEQLIGDLLSVGGKAQEERDRLAQELRAVTLERDEWKTGAEYQQQQATQLLQQLADADAQIRQFEKINDTRDELECENTALQQEVADLQAQLEAAAVTPSQQPDGTAERLERVQQMIGHVLGWYTCTDWFDEVERAEAWEQVGALLGRLQREAG